MRHAARVRILAPSELQAQPWKNGGGVTHEILRWPHGAGDDYQLRISLADDRVAAPFSLFPGYRRWSYLAAPAPIVLHVAGVPHRLAQLGDVLEVDGEVPITCELPQGPTRLLNFLIRRGLHARPGRGPCDQPVRFVFALAALPWLAREHSAILEPPARVELDDRAVWLADR